MTHRITLDLPETLYQRLLYTAEATQKSLEAILLRAIQHGSPPDWQDIPPEFQADIAALDRLNDSDLWTIARSQLTSTDLERYDDLLDRHRSGTLTPTEQLELQQQRHSTERFMLRKAHAIGLLRWRGHNILDLGVSNHVSIHSCGTQQEPILSVSRPVAELLSWLCE